jgi:hypothetical protein
MKAIHLVGASALAMTIVLPVAAFASEPAPGSTENYSGSLAELATGVRSTPSQATVNQTPRDAVSGQSADVLDSPKLDADSGLEFRQSVPGSSQPNQLGDTGIHEVGHRSARQTIEVENDETHVAALRTETIVANETASASPGASEQYIGGSDDGSSIRTKKPRRNRNATRGRRQHKP